MFINELLITTYFLPKDQNKDIIAEIMLSITNHSEENLEFRIASGGRIKWTGIRLSV